LVEGREGVVVLDLKMWLDLHQRGCAEKIVAIVGGVVVGVVFDR
jgi:hypothetical protein